MRGAVMRLHLCNAYNFTTTASSNTIAATLCRSNFLKGLNFEDCRMLFGVQFLLALFLFDTAAVQANGT